MKPGIHNVHITEFGVHLAEEVSVLQFCVGHIQVSTASVVAGDIHRKVVIAGDKDLCSTIEYEVFHMFSVELHRFAGHERVEALTLAWRGVLNIVYKDDSLVDLVDVERVEEVLHRIVEDPTLWGGERQKEPK